MLERSPSTSRSLSQVLSVFSASLLLAIAANSVVATDFIVSSASDISDAMDSAQPGDVLIMSNGVWTNQDIDFAGFGSAPAPITLRAETPGGVTLNGRSQLAISGRYLVIDGLNFEGGGDDSIDYIIEFRGSQGEANDCRLTNTQILNYNASSRSHQYHWVEIFGQDNRVDHCRFQGQDHRGVTLVVRLDDNGQAARHRIDHNAFLDRPVGESNGYEAIRVGTSARHTTSAQVVVEHNLFENCDGEIEVISHKSEDNIYRYNTFRSCAGTLTLRHGGGALVEGNFFLGEGKDRSGGIRVVDSDHVIINNYIADIDDRADAAISIAAGIAGGPANGYQLVDNIDIHNNTIVDVNGGAVIFDWGFGDSDSRGVQDQVATNVSFVNNLIRSSRTLFEGEEGSGYQYTDNIVFGASLGISGRSGLQQVNPMLAFDLNGDGLWRPASNSPAVNGGTNLSSIATDVDGQSRVGAIDIGADELSSETITLRPLTRNDVGPYTDGVAPMDPVDDPMDPVDDPMDPVDPPEGTAFALQAEDFAAVTDPNNDGDVWTVVDDSDAHGGQAIESPSGSRTNLPGHDTLVLYNILFNEAGAYTVYYRAYGTSGGSDSFYAPDDLGVDPTINEATSNNGAYRWETGVDFEVAQSDVGDSQQLRIGRREGGNRIDAIVIHENGELTDEELDALFAENQNPNPNPSILGDVNLDGEVDFFDISPFIVLLSGNGFQNEADMDQNGLVNFFDISPFIQTLSGQ